MAGTNHAAWMSDMEQAAGFLRLLAGWNQTALDTGGAMGIGDAHIAVLAERVESQREAADLGDTIADSANTVHVEVGTAMARAGRRWVPGVKEFMGA
jgi:hypothetical protein